MGFKPLYSYWCWNCPILGHRELLWVGPLLILTEHAVVDLSFGMRRISHLHCSLPAPDLVRAKLLHSCLTVCDPMDCSPPGSSVHGILQARTLQWVATLPSRGSSRRRDQTCVSCVGRWVLYHWASWEAILRLHFTKGCSFKFCVLESLK